MEQMFIGGLARDCPEDALSALLSKYGALSRVHIPDGAVMGSGNRGFAFADITFKSPADRNKLLSCVNGSVWRGSKLKVERCAQLPFEERPILSGDAVSSDTVTSGDTKGKVKRKRPLVRHADGPNELVTEKSVDGKRRDWWYRGKYGRPVAVMRVRRPDGVLVMVDPAHHKDRFEKLFGSVRPKPIANLLWSLDCDTVDAVHGSASETESDTSDEEVEKEIVKLTTTEEKAPETLPKYIDERLKTLFAELSDIQPCGTFYRSKPLEELRFEWVKQRSDLRQDFKRRAKQAKRITRKRQKL